MLRRLFLCFVLGAFALRYADAILAQNVPGTPWRAVDDLRRVIADSNSAPPLREEKKVGLFYFLWFEDKTPIPVDKNAPQDDPRPYNISQIERVEPNPTQNDALFGENGQMCYWGEPLFGYYDARDPYVVDRHLRLIADAGVDVLVFDVTNLETYPDVYRPLCDRLLKMRDEGFPAPQVSFITNTNVENAVDALWKDFYSREKYRPLFFEWKGKPLLVANPEKVPEELRDFFTLRDAYWPTEGPNNSHNRWRWVDAYPQPYSWSDDPNRPEELVVSPAQNLARDANAHDVWMSERIGRGRSFVYGAEKQRYAPDEGLNFAQQWSRALELDPDFLFITGWNEWIAGRWKIEWADGRKTFVDQYDHEFSRDIEPARGLHGDAYYLQAIDGIRKFKGVADAPRAVGGDGISFDSPWEKWRAVAPSLRDYRGENARRDFKGRGGTHYFNAGGRADFDLVKVARDGEYVYFYLQTVEPIEESASDDILLALDLDDDLATGWRGAELLVGGRGAERFDQAAADALRENIRRVVEQNRLDDAPEFDDERVQERAYATEEQRAALERFDSDARKKANARNTLERLKERAREWRPLPEYVQGLKRRVEGRNVLVAAPVALFSKLDAVSFKWIDSTSDLPNPDDFYLGGDVAPEGSFFYRVILE